MIDDFQPGSSALAEAAIELFARYTPAHPGVVRDRSSRLQGVLREWQKELDATPPAVLAAKRKAADYIPPAVSAIHAGRQKYTHIPAPILAIYASPPAPGEIPVGTEAQAKAFETGVPSARVVRLPHARHEGSPRTKKMFCAK